MKKKKHGCLRSLLIVLLTFCVLYFSVGEGKTVILKKIYPIEYAQQVEKYAEEFSLDKNLVYAVIKVESNFNPDAVSVVEAKGLMQLMDETAEECNRLGRFGYNIPGDIYSPDCNIRLGCSYISRLFDKYGDMRLAVAAYNAGVGNVDKWLVEDAGLENIPYKETRNYVKKVFDAFEQYNRLYKTNE